MTLMNRILTCYRGILLPSSNGAEYYKMGMKPFIRICRESGAVYKIGKMVRVNRHILEQHIRKLRLKEEK